MRVFRILENLLPSFYTFKVTLLGNPGEMMGEIHRLGSKEKSETSTKASSEQTNGSLNSSMNSNLIEMTSPKLQTDLSDDEEKLETEAQDPKYYEAAVLFHSLPELTGICDRLLTLFEQTEAGGLHLLYIFIDNELLMDYKLFQCFILNAFIWGSTPISDYFEDKEKADYLSCVNQGLVDSLHLGQL